MRIIPSSGFGVQTGEKSLDPIEHNMNTIAASRQIRWVEANGPAGVAACAKAGRSKSGVAFHGSVVRRNPRAEPTNWMASVNSTGLGEFPQREIAMRRVEELIESSMLLVLHDWEVYRATKERR